MKKLRVAAICAAFALSMSIFSTVAFAVEEPKEPHTPAIAATESAIPEEPESTGAPDSAEAAEIPESGMTTPPAGTGTVIETATEKDGREFYTITTPENNVFYLVIDRSRQTENVYFLDAVTEKDLLALAEKAGESIAETEATALEAEAQPPTPQETQAEQEPTEEQSGVPVNLIVVLAAAAAFGIGAWYFKVYRKRREAAETRDEYEAESLPEQEPYEQDYEEYGEEPNDAPPWDEGETDSEKDEEENE